MSRYPSLYQLNTRVWLTALSAALGRKATLDDISDQQLDHIASMGFEWVWLLSVWQTGDASRNISRSRKEWLDEFKVTLRDLKEEDIGGSGFAITGYKVHTDLGGDEALARLRQRLAARKMKLMLDFVPNHMALDHGWIDSHPDFFIDGNEELLAAQPKNYTRVRSMGKELIKAFGRDPYFDGWPDTLQLNYANPACFKAMAGELARISSQCDGVRCDMAMLLLPDVFERTWGQRPEEFWPDVIATVKQHHPEFIFMAEVYWDLEWTLQQQGFDYTYDKKLYDRLKEGYARPVREHLWAAPDFQDRSVRFLENHDEPRIAATMVTQQLKAAAVITYFCPGLRFFHQGQLEGFRKRISPHLVRGPREHADQEIQQFFQQLLQILKIDAFRDGNWSLLECKPAWDGNGSCDNFISASWRDHEGRLYLVVVNYSRSQSQCYVQLLESELVDHDVTLDDLFSDIKYTASGNDLILKGLYLDEPAWTYFLFEVIRTR